MICAWCFARTAGLPPSGHLFLWAIASPLNSQCASHGICRRCLKVQMVSISSLVRPSACNLVKAEARSALRLVAVGLGTTTTAPPGST